MNPLLSITKTLFMACEEYIPAPTVKTVFLRAVFCPELNGIATARQWHLEQSFAPYADDLRDSGYPVEAAVPLPQKQLDTVLIVASRFAEENKALLARAWAALRPGGWLIIAQHNDLGAKRLDGLVKELSGGDISTLTKHHCRAVAAQKQERQNDKLMEQWQNAMAPVEVPGTSLRAAPGMFSWRKVDAGSALLVDCLPDHLSGEGADIAAGWGYLSSRVLERYPAIRVLHLYEAERHALDLSRHNLAEYEAKLRFHWCDAARPLPQVPAGGFDWAISNPPAHDLLGSTPEVTAALFREAKTALKPGGKLWLVAGRHLPYERTLSELFTQVTALQQTGEYKVIEAVK